MKSYPAVKYCLFWHDCIPFICFSEVTKKNDLQTGKAGTISISVIKSRT